MQELTRAERIEAVALLIDMLDLVDAETEDLEPDTAMDVDDVNHERAYNGLLDRGAGDPYDAEP